MIEDLFEVSFYEVVGNISALLVVIFIFDYLFTWNSQARWFILHAVFNFLGVIFGFPDLVVALLNPVEAMQEPCYTKMPLFIIAAIHLYHIIAFEMRAEDWFHHIVFVGGICSFGFIGRWGHVENTFSFFLSGFPGGMDYIMLALVKYGKMDPLTEKNWNARINVWIRGPGCCIASYCLFVSYRYSEQPFWHPIGVIIMMLMVFVNGQYYMQQVVGNTYRRDEKYNS
eukprot:TRINITY_DN10743_c0_g1_i1.p1 TRINITY_DN10743_c0_g1~~TRINITY_DN10743_c0_g1_i1.p1  ORF type:complete len:234 (-),score=31.69 TRINITY_DN10743_c0_g1_i1:22-702(-)